MTFNSKQLPNGRWGIYCDLKLLASIGCPKTCKKIIRYLESSTQRKPFKIDLLKTKTRKKVIEKYSSEKQLETASSGKRKR